MGAKFKAKSACFEYQINDQHETAIPSDLCNPKELQYSEANLNQIYPCICHDWMNDVMHQVQKWEVKLEKIQFHKCHQCPKAFLNFDNLTMHVKKHEDWSHNHVFSSYVKIEKFNILKCDTCQQGFLTQRKLMLHRLVHIQHYNMKKEVDFEDTSIVKPYKCPDCDYRFVAESTLDAHYVLHLPYPHICYCGIGYYKLEDLTSHKELMNCKIPRIKDKKLINNNSINKSNDIIKRKTIYGGKRPPIPRPPLDVDFPRNKNGQGQCPECHKWFHSRKNAELHYRGVHRNERPYSCNYCHKSFTQGGALNLHVRTHFGVRDYKCRYCDKSFSSLTTQIVHERTHTGERPYKCKVCDKAFSDPSAFKRHERIHTGDKRYRCSLCPVAFTDSSALYAHKKRHDVNRTRDFGCEKCVKRFYHKNALTKHYSIMHCNEYNFICDNCDQKFSGKCNLINHIQRWHATTNKTYTCKICSKVLLTESSLKSHVKVVHANVKDYTCQHCFRRFKLKSKLDQHLIYYHSNSNQFMCHYCSNSYFTKAILNVHILRKHLKIHCKKCLRYFWCKSDLEKHRWKESKHCEICDKVFFCEGSLEKHLNVHIKPKGTYECNYCGYTFIRRYLIIKHILRYHSKKKYECDHCQRRFAFKTSIRNHIMTCHLEVFRCNICYKRFFSNFNLKRHKMTNCTVAKYICNTCKKPFKSRSRLRKHKIRHMGNLESFKCPLCVETFTKTTHIKRHMRRCHER